MAIRLGQPLPDDRIDSIFATMDKNKDGRVQADEFMEWFGKEETMVNLFMCTNNVSLAYMYHAQQCSCAHN